MTITKYQSGMIGQQEAESYLAAKGYRILERNYRVRTGEIDLIARFENYIVFIEVKYRRGVKFGFPREAVSIAKQRQIVRTAMHYITVQNLSDQDFRFDVVEVLDQNGLKVNHIENAFDAY